MSEWCCVDIFVTGHFRPIRCSKAAKYQVDGKWYCGTHSPAAKAKRNEKSAQRCRETVASWDAKAKEQKRIDGLLAALAEYGITTADELRERIH